MSVDRVAYVLNRFPKVSQTFIVQELAELSRRGVDLRILSLRSPKETLSHPLVARRKLLERTHYDPAVFADELAHFEPQLVHAHFATEATGVARDLARSRDIPFTFTAHGYDIYDRPPADFAERSAAAAAVVTVSEINADHLANRLGVPRSQIHVIRNGVDTEHFTPAAVASDPPQLLCVARLHPIKNHGVLLQACASLHDRGLAFRCVLVGEGSARERIEAQIVELGLTEVVEIVGGVDETEKLVLLQRSTVAVLSSDSEGLGVFLLEAAACRVPSVATAVGGTPEAIEDGVTGILVPRRDAERFADAVERLLREPELRRAMGEAGRRRIVERFSQAHQTDQLLALWSSIVDQS
jgi:glycosyltransferase involved in cell wall biosynthesis